MTIIIILIAIILVIWWCTSREGLTLKSDGKCCCAFSNGYVHIETTAECKKNGGNCLNPKACTGSTNYCCCYVCNPGSSRCTVSLKLKSECPTSGPNSWNQQFCGTSSRAPGGGCRGAAN